ncbi:hypothetical protein SeMB42_g05553 [Synchytrium endobioticum]|uniref:ERCC4 domain-containing protein n=1 Tax=Synchytrium endobioticum TaxID=286115 RepID=A0A507CU15_9FUNG|nr:hypothetical protein SeMB42_g05553 [Synchytrium endobioticum]TPX42647.1 hypothetical protein SeLEV6574_g05487 [Synchytrium endobioticum]
MLSVLSFHEDIIYEFLQPASPSATSSNVAAHGDGLLILARGLGLRHVILTLLRIHAKKNALVLLLNTPSREVEFLKEDIAAAACARGDLGGEDEIIAEEDRKASKLIRVIDNETPATEREALYLSGGILSVTSRILVVDMLNKVVPVHLVCGIFLNHAHRITDTSTEAFVLRLYRDGNKDGFIKAFSDYPEAWTQGIWKLEKTMKILFLRKVFIWPRFHVRVSECLGPSKVYEERIEMTKRMKEIQAALIDCITACVNELKRANPSVDVEEFTIENAMFRSFDQVVRVQLDPIWHRVSLKSKQIVGDLKTLRQLLNYLSSYDCVTFNSFVEALIASNAAGHTSVFRGADMESPWMMMDSAQLVFKLARERVYLQTKNALVTFQGLPPGVDPVLEEQPKWRHLKTIIKEIEAQRRTMLENRQNVGPILIMATGDRTCSQIREVLEGMDLTIIKSEGTAEDSLAKALSAISSASTSSIAARKKNKRRINELEFEVQDDNKTIGNESNGNIQEDCPAPTKRNTTFSTEGSERLLRRMMFNFFRWKGSLYKMRRSINKKTGGAGSSSNGSATNVVNGRTNDKSARGGTRGQPTSKRRRTRGGGTTGNNGSEGGDVQGDVPASFEKEQEDIAFYMHAFSQVEANKTDLHEDKDFDASLFTDYYGLVDESSAVIIRPYATSSTSRTGGQAANGDDDARALEEIKPQWVVLYDPDLGFIRRLEVYKAGLTKSDSGGGQVNIYLMYYGNSTEEQVYLSMIRKEKEAFEKLIHEKSVMAIPIDQDGRSQIDPDEVFYRNLDTRNAGGQRIPAKDSNLVVVDVREFRSSLPSLLHAKRLSLKPCTLEVGDYILSPLICVERKSVSDLIGSFRSGRLYNQAQSMCHYYRYPILLIEFDQHKSFSLQSASEMKSDISIADLSSKLVLLTVAFPALKIDEPSMEKAMAVGVENSEAIDSTFAITPADVLRSLPGITSKNYRHVMCEVKDLKTLSEMTLEDLQKIIGNEFARKLHEFFNKDPKDDDGISLPRASSAQI